MARFTGRCKHTIKIPSKPIDEGFKIWAIADNGYLLNWLFYSRIDGTIGLDKKWTRKTKEGYNFAPTQAVVLELLERVQRTDGGSHVVWLDNLFTTQRLLSFLRDRGIGAAGTARTNSNIDYRLAKLKELSSTVDKIPWGQLYCAVSEDEKVIEFGWKDHGLVLFMSTVSDGKGMVNRRRRRPRTTATSAKATRAVFGDRVVIILPIPDFIDLYNHCMNGVDKADQLRSYYFTQRIHRKGWKALWHFLLDVAITNS